MAAMSYGTNVDPLRIETIGNKNQEGWLSGQSDRLETTLGIGVKQIPHTPEINRHAMPRSLTEDKYTLRNTADTAELFGKNLLFGNSFINRCEWIIMIIMLNAHSVIA